MTGNNDAATPANPAALTAGLYSCIGGAAGLHSDSDTIGTSGLCSSASARGWLFFLYEGRHRLVFWRRRHAVGLSSGARG